MIELGVWLIIAGLIFVIIAFKMKEKYALKIASVIVFIICFITFFIILSRW